MNLQFSAVDVVGRPSSRSAEPSHFAAAPTSASMKNLLCILSMLIFSTLSGGCAISTPDAPQAQIPRFPPYLTADAGCAIVMGGSVGGHFDDAQVAELWHMVNSSVTNELFDLLSTKGYEVHKLIIQPDQTVNTEQHAVMAAAAHQCNRLLQVSHHANQDAFGAYFRFDVELMKFEPKDRPTPEPSQRRFSMICNKVAH